MPMIDSAVSRTSAAGARASRRLTASTLISTRVPGRVCRAAPGRIAALVLLGMCGRSRAPGAGWRRAQRTERLALGDEAPRELGARLGHPPPCEQRDGERDEHQHARDLVDIVLLVGLQDHQQVVADVEPHAQQREHDRGDDDGDEVAHRRGARDAGFQREKIPSRERECTVVKISFCQRHVIGSAAHDARTVRRRFDKILRAAE